MVLIRPERTHNLWLHIFVFLVTEDFQKLTLTPTWKTAKSRMTTADRVGKERPEARPIHNSRQFSERLLRIGRTSQNMGLI